MKKWLDKMKTMKGGLWIALLAVCAAALLFFPFPGNQPAGMTEEEQRVSATLSRIAGAGEVRVSISYSQAASSFGASSKTPSGAVIVARGADSVEVRLNLARAAEALLGLSAREVEVFVMEETP